MLTAAMRSAAACIGCMPMSASHVVWWMVMPDLIGFHTPQPDSGDDEWDDLAFDRFMACAGSPLWFDTAGKFDWCEGQMQMERTAAKDGYVLPVITEGPSKGIQLSRSTRPIRS